MGGHEVSGEVVGGAGRYVAVFSVSVSVEKKRARIQSRKREKRARVQSAEAEESAGLDEKGRSVFLYD